MFDIKHQQRRRKVASVVSAIALSSLGYASVSHAADPEARSVSADNRRTPAGIPSRRFDSEKLGCCLQQSSHRLSFATAGGNYTKK